MIIEQTILEGNINRISYHSEYYYCIYNNGEVVSKSESIDDYTNSNLVVDSINSGFGSDSYEELENEILNRV